MKKIVFLGCENSHANKFLKYIQEDEKYKDVEVLGVYSDDLEACEKLKETFGVKIMKSYDEAVNEADGIVVTARHGDNHLKYALPYFKKGMAMFIDKPITIKEEDALELVKKAKETGVKLTGGSCIRFDEKLLALKQDADEKKDGETWGGFVRAPLSNDERYGGFFFYSQHLVEAMCTVFGKYPKSVKAFENGSVTTVVFRYENYDVTGTFTLGAWSYFAYRCTQKGIDGGKIFDNMDPSFKAEWDEFYDLLSGGEQTADFKDFISPVFILNAVNNSIKSGKEEPVKTYEV